MVTDVQICGASIVCLSTATVCGLALVTGTKEQMWDVFQMQRHRGLALVTGIGYQVEEQMCVGGRFAINW